MHPITQLLHILNKKDDSQIKMQSVCKITDTQKLDKKLLFLH